MLVLLALLFQLHFTVLGHGKIAFTFHTAPSERGRIIEVAIIEDNYERHSATTLDPTDTLTRVEWRGVPEGEHEVHAILVDDQGKVLGTVTKSFIMAR